MNSIRGAAHHQKVKALLDDAAARTEAGPRLCRDCSPRCKSTSIMAANSIAGYIQGLLDGVSFTHTAYALDQDSG